MDAENTSLNEMLVELRHKYSVEAVAEIGECFLETAREWLLSYKTDFLRDSVKKSLEDNSLLPIQEAKGGERALQLLIDDFEEALDYEST